jgi:Restriction endonuclease
MGELPWERFEQFAHDLIARLPGFTNCHRQGGQGHAQGGIDVFADDVQAQRWAFSNKRYTRTPYQPHHVTKHVSETTYAASRYVILLSSIASPAVRQKVDEHSNWELWDVSDLSQRVRDVAAANPDAARELIDHHFGPRWRRDFLGLPALAAFLSPVDFFRELLGTARLFHHSFELIGRASQLAALTDFVRTGGPRVAILPGRGGIGKSRLLRALALAVEEGAPEPAIRFLVEGVPLTVEALDELPNRPCLVVIDDAHRCEGIDLLLAYAHRRPNLKLLLATRPHGIDRIHNSLTRSGFDLRESIDQPALAPLTLEETRDLACAAMGSGRDVSPLTVERLARVTRDCPLATVIGGRLLAENAIPPELLAQDESFRRTVFDRFQDELLGRLGPWLPPDFARRALWVLAAINPIPATLSQDLLRQIADFLGADPVELARLIGELERVGLLVRRGGRLRLTPDILADHILASACLTPQNRPNGYAQRAFEYFRNTCPDLVLRNIAELDWRVRASGSEESGLINGMWTSLEAAFRDGPPAARIQIIDLVTGAAYYQPRRALILAEVAMCNEAAGNDPDQSSIVEGEPEGQHDVLQCLPELLRRSAYHPETLPRCLEILWEISLRLGRPGGNDSRQAIQVILDLAKYEHDKPVWVNEAVASSVRRWSRATPTPDQRQVILEIVDLLLAKAGSDTWSEGNRFHICSFYVSHAVVREIRRMALAILSDLLNSSDVALQQRVLASLEGALNGSMPQWPQPLTLDLLAEWEPDQLTILELLSKFLAQPQPPFLQLRTFEAVRFQATHGPRPAVRERAQAVVRQLEASFEVRLTRLLLTRLARWDQFDDALDGEDETRDVAAELTERHRRSHRLVVSEIWERYPDAENAFAFLAETTGALRSIEREVDPGHVLWYMLEARPAEAIRFGRIAITTPESPLTRCLPTFLMRGRLVDPEGTTRLAKEMLESPADEAGFFRATLATHYSWNWPPGSPLSEEDIAIIRRLLADPDPPIRVRALGSLQHLAVTSTPLAIELAMSVDVGDSAEIAEELGRLTVHSQPGSLTGFTAGDFGRMLVRFESVTSLGHWVCELLASLAGTMPDAVLDCVLRRVTSEETLGYGKAFHPLPDRGLSTLSNVFAVINGHDRQADLARRVRDQAVPRRRFSGALLARLFRAVSGNYGPRGLGVLREWVDSGDSARIVAAVEFLREAGPTFVFEQRDFVEHALERADSQGDDSGDRVYSTLLQLSVSFGRTGFTGEIFPQDLALRDRAAAAREALLPGTRLYRLFEDIRQNAESNIRQHAERIDEDEDF